MSLLCCVWPSFWMASLSHAPDESELKFRVSEIVNMATLSTFFHHLSWTNLLPSCFKRSHIGQLTLLLGFNSIHWLSKLSNLETMPCFLKFPKIMFKVIVTWRHPIIPKSETNIPKSEQLNWEAPLLSKIHSKQHFEFFSKSKPIICPSSHVAEPVINFFFSL